LIGILLVFIFCSENSKQIHLLSNHLRQEVDPSQTEDDDYFVWYFRRARKFL
jgi:hypothetical protein